MKRAFSAFLSMLLLLVSMSQSSIYVGFKLNESGIIKNLCVNTDKPDLKCQGKCYLQSKLKNLQEDSNSKPLPPNFEKFEINITVASIAETCFTFFEVTQDYSGGIAIAYQNPVLPVTEAPPRS